LDKGGREGRGMGNCVLITDCVRVIGKGGGEGREWENCVLIADCVRVIG